MSRPTPEEQAADWLIRRDRGLTPSEQDEYLQWLAADPRHGDALARQQATWRELDLLADWRPEDAPEPNPSLLAPPPRKASQPLRWLAPVALAAAAGMALTLFLNSETRSPAPVASVAPIAAVPPVVATGYEKRLLDDGSVVELNRGAAVSVSYTPGERRVRLLTGEVRFTVAKNPTRPFIVSAAGVETRAVGTAFNVRLTAASVEVLVTEGHVQVTRPVPAASRSSAPPPAPAPLVASGERVTVPLFAPSSPLSAPPAVVPVAATAEELARARAWQPRLLEFSSTPLAEVVAEFNRHNTIQLSLADPALASFPVIASFRSDNVEGFVRLLEATADIRAERRAETISLRSAISP